MTLPAFLTDLNPEIYLSENYLVLDKETTNYDKGSALDYRNRHLLSVWRYQGNTSVVRGSEYELGQLLEDISRADYVVAHNAKFELQWLQREGLDISKILVFDTMLAEYVLLGNRKKPLDLGAVASRYGLGDKEAYINTCFKAGICPSELPISLLEQRCIRDVQQTYGIFKQQRRKLHSASLLPALFTRCIFTPVLADIEGNGMHVDPEVVEQEYTSTLNAMNELRIELDKITGGINLKSVKQKAEFLYGTMKFKELRRRGEPIRTSSGAPKTDVGTICSLKATNKKQKRFQSLFKEWNLLASSLSKNLEFFYGIATEVEDHVFKASFNQAVTATHRLSSSGKKIKFEQFDKAKGCQFQNFPRRYKGLFSARNRGWYVGDRDGAQLEFRVAAYLGRDIQANEDIKDGFDVHSNTANILTGAGQHTDRQGAKEHTFKPLYGGSSGTEAEQAYYRAFKERYRGVAQAQQEWIDEALKEQAVVTATGLKFYYPGTKVTNSGYVVNTTNICNYPVQSLATADIIPIAVVYMWHRMKEANLQAFLVNTIHDSIITEEPPEETEAINEIAERCFTEDVYHYLKQVYDIDFNVPLAVDCHVSEHWGT